MEGVKCMFAFSSKKSMARILTGIQSSGKPHLGNLLGAILPGVELSQRPDNECFFFIADMHSVTSIKDAASRIEHSQAVAAAWIACGLDTDRHVFYRQSDVAEVGEFAWYLNCFTPFPMLANAHSFKDKSDKLSDVNAGLFTYPVLMAADILMYDAEFVPVGKDQQQHLEMTRDIAGALNAQLSEEILVLPEARIQTDVQTVPGTDGQKMSKSYGNIIDVFAPEKALKKQVMKVVTDSLGLDDPKDPDSCNVFALYSLLADQGQLAEMRENYRNGGFGYGHAKLALFELILERFKNERTEFTRLMEDTNALEEELKKGAEKARAASTPVLQRVRRSLGFKPA